MAITPRLYQQEAIEAVRREWRNGRRKTVVCMPCATGKTVVFLFVVYAAKQNGNRSLILVNRDEPVSQAVEKLEQVGVRPGVVKGSYNQWSYDVVVASVQTLWSARRYRIIPRDFYGVIIIDECHFANSKTYRQLLEWFGYSSYMLGVTATPFRGDRRSIAEAGWESVAYIYSIQQAIEDNFLCPIKFERVDTQQELIGVKVCPDPITGELDFGTKSLANAINNDERNKAIVQASKDFLNGRKTLGFCADVNHTVDLANAYRRAGVEAYAIYGTMDERTRRRLIDAHREGRFPVLTNCQILTHGYDDPSLNALVMAAPTKSKVLYMQRIGRGMRRCKDKEDCVVLDVVDASKKHTLTIGKELMKLQDDIAEKAASNSSAPEMPPWMAEATRSVASGRETK